MTNLLEQAINSNDGDAAAKLSIGPTPARYRDSSARLPPMLAFDPRPERWLLAQLPSGGLQRPQSFLHGDR